MARNFIRLRFIQLKRESEALGFIYSAFYLILLSFCLLFFYNQANLYPNVIYAAGLIALSVSGIHFNRKDTKFISTTTAHPAFLYFIEYSFFSIPLFAIMAFSPYWHYTFLLILSYFILSFINYKPVKRSKNWNFYLIVPFENIEWIAGIRKNFWYILPIYILAIGLLYIQYISLVLLWLLLVIIASFYKECEPLNIIEVKELPAKLFVKQKLLTHLKTYLVFSTPLVIGYSLFNPDTSWLAILILLLSVINLCLIIVSKYALYHPNTKLSENNISVGIALVSIFIPFLIPLPLFMFIRGYQKALTNLNYYLNAYN